MISLIMTTYNGEQLIIEQLDSIRMQTQKPDQVTIFDDCSKDNTVAVVREYIKKYELVTWSITKNEVNKGYSFNFTDAMKVAKGDLIFLSDQDDIWLPDKIEKMAKIMEKNITIELLASNVEIFYNGKAPQKVNFEQFSRKKELIHIKGYKRWIKPARPGCSMCFRSSLLEDYEALWFNEYPHDCLLWGLAVLKGTAYIYNKTTLKFRRHDLNTSNCGGGCIKYRIQELNREIEIMLRMEMFVEKKKINIAKFIQEQLKVYRKRKEILENKNIVGALSMLSKINYYGRRRFWFTDVFYCLKM